jgi:hypothetical protein
MNVMPDLLSVCRNTTMSLQGDGTVSSRSAIITPVEVHDILPDLLGHGHVVIHPELSRTGHARVLDPAVLAGVVGRVDGQAEVADRREVRREDGNVFVVAVVHGEGDHPVYAVAAEKERRVDLAGHGCWQKLEVADSDGRVRRQLCGVDVAGHMEITEGDGDDVMVSNWS